VNLTAPLTLVSGPGGNMSKIGGSVGCHKQVVRLLQPLPPDTLTQPPIFNLPLVVDITTD